MRSIISRPMPGMEKTFSIKTLPPKAEAKLMPMTVTTGSSAFLSACLRKITFSFTPLARAVRM